MTMTDFAHQHPTAPVDAGPGHGHAPGRHRVRALPRPAAVARRGRLDPAHRLPGLGRAGLAGHNLGMAEMAGSLRELRPPGPLPRPPAAGLCIDALTGLQVEEPAGHDPGEIVARYAEVGPGRSADAARPFRLCRTRPTLPETQVVDGAAEPWTFGFLFDDHPHPRPVDAPRSTPPGPPAGRWCSPPEHDGVLVADVVAEWAERHGRRSPWS